MRKGVIDRKTKETNIHIMLDLDGHGKSDIRTGIGFLDHMLTLFAFHGRFDLEITCDGDIQVDSHHTAEDIGITLGDCFTQAIGDKKGIQRFATAFVPMDEALVRTSLDISGRPVLVFQPSLTREWIGWMAAEDFQEFFKGFVNHSLITLHCSVLYGENNHHKIEGIFKSFGMALKSASHLNGEDIMSSKGLL